MNDSDKILKALTEGQARIYTILEALAAGQRYIREHMATKEETQKISEKMATKEETATKAETASKADIQDLKASMSKKINNHDRRLDIIEDELDLPHPNKN